MIQNSNCAKFGLLENYGPKLEANFWDSSKKCNCIDRGRIETKVVCACALLAVVLKKVPGRTSSSSVGQPQ